MRALGKEGCVHGVFKGVCSVVTSLSRMRKAACLTESVLSQLHKVQPVRVLLNCPRLCFSCVWIHCLIHFVWCKHHVLLREDWSAIGRVCFVLARLCMLLAPLVLLSTQQIVLHFVYWAHSKSFCISFIEPTTPFNATAQARTHAFEHLYAQTIMYTQTRQCTNAHANTHTHNFLIMYPNKVNMHAGTHVHTNTSMHKCTCQYT